MGEPRTTAQFFRQAALLALIMLGSLGLYLSVLWWRGPEATLVTWLPLDEWIAFRPEWVWIYLLPYLIGPLAVGLLSPATFAWFVRRGLLLVLISLAIFVLLPTRTIRPDISDLGDSATTDLYRNMIALDGPAANAAPSLHVSLTCLLLWALCRDFPRGWPLTAGLIGLVWLSTLFTRQHHLLDVATGVLLASLLALPIPSRARKGAGLSPPLPHGRGSEAETRPTSKNACQVRFAPAILEGDRGKDDPPD
jgi:hypothetical protein